MTCLCCGLVKSPTIYDQPLMAREALMTYSVVLQVGRDFPPPVDLDVDLANLDENAYRLIKYEFSEDVLRLPSIQVILLFKKSRHRYTEVAKARFKEPFSLFLHFFFPPRTSPLLALLLIRFPTRSMRKSARLYFRCHFAAARRWYRGVMCLLRRRCPLPLLTACLLVWSCPADKNKINLTAIALINVKGFADSRCQPRSSLTLPAL